MSHSSDKSSPSDLQKQTTESAPTDPSNVVQSNDTTKATSVPEVNISQSSKQPDISDTPLQAETSQPSTPTAIPLDTQPDSVLQQELQQGTDEEVEPGQKQENFELDKQKMQQGPSQKIQKKLKEEINNEIKKKLQHGANEEMQQEEKQHCEKQAIEHGPVPKTEQGLVVNDTSLTASDGEVSQLPPLGAITIQNQPQQEVLHGSGQQMLNWPAQDTQQVSAINDIAETSQLSPLEDVLQTTQPESVPQIEIQHEAEQEIQHEPDQEMQHDAENQQIMEEDERIEPAQILLNMSQMVSNWVERFLESERRRNEYLAMIDMERRMVFERQYDRIYHQQLQQQQAQQLQQQRRDQQEQLLLQFLTGDHQPEQQDYDAEENQLILQINKRM